LADGMPVESASDAVCPRTFLNILPMTDSLRDQLLKLGFAEPAKVQPAKDHPRSRSPAASQPRAHPDKPTNSNPAAIRDRDRRRHGPPRTSARPPPNHTAHSKPPQGAAPRVRTDGRTQAEIDLGKAYALRAQTEKAERIEAERLKQEAARSKREAKSKAADLLKDNTLNDPAAELVRHFEYGGKIKRIHVNAGQLKALNAGELGVVQLDGRYLLVSVERARQVRELLPSLVALLVDPDAPAADDPYADPAYRVPDDLVW
jgi:uncharacterized protein YaiL (DUF2058 family)